MCKRITIGFLILALIAVSIGGCVGVLPNQSSSLPLLDLPKTGQPLPEHLQYRLETSTEMLPRSAMVYRNAPTSMTEKEIHQMMETLGMKQETQSLIDDEITYHDNSKIMIINKVDGTFKYIVQERWMKDTQPPKRLLSRQDAITRAEKLLRDLEQWREDMILCGVSLSNVNQGTEESTIPIEITVSFGRTLGGREVLGNTIDIDFGDQGEIDAILRSFREFKAYQEYPLKEVQTALQEMPTGAIKINSEATLAVVKKVELSYWGFRTTQGSSFLQPVFAFSGDAQVGDRWEPFYAWVPAVSER